MTITKLAYASSDENSFTTIRLGSVLLTTYKKIIRVARYHSKSDHLNSSLGVTIGHIEKLFTPLDASLHVAYDDTNKNIKLLKITKVAYAGSDENSFTIIRLGSVLLITYKKRIFLE